MWAWGYVLGWLVTAVLVCRSCWLGMGGENRDESPGMARAVSLAAGFAAGLVWPLWWAGVVLRPVLWPEPDPDLDTAYATFQEYVETHEHDTDRDR